MGDVVARTNPCVWCVYVYVFVCLFQFGLVFVILVSFEKLMSDCSQTWIKGAMGVLLKRNNLLYVNEVKGHVPRARVI